MTSRTGHSPAVPTSPRWTRAAAALVVPLLACACDGRFAEQEIAWRRDAEADALEVLFLYEGIETQVHDERKYEVVVDDIGSLRDRRRFFLFDTFPFDIDLDRAAGSDELPPSWLPLVEAVSLGEHGLYLDGEGRLAGYQRFRLSGLTAELERVNRLVREHVLALAADGRLAAELDFLDERSRELWVQAAKAGATWLALGADGVFELRVPASRDDLLHAVQGALNEGVLNPNAEPLDRQILTLLSSVRFDGELAILRIGREGAPVQRYRFDLERQEPWDPRLLEEARKRGWPLDEELTADAIRARFDGE